MKKLFALFMSLALMLTLFACGSQSPAADLSEPESGSVSSELEQSGVQAAPEPEPPKHKTGMFSEITADEYVSQIKIGFNYMSYEDIFGVDNWVDAKNVPSIPLALMAAGSVGNTNLFSTDTVLYRGDKKHVKLRFQTEPTEEVVENSQVAFVIHVNKSIAFESKPVKLTISGARVTMRDGSAYPVDELNGVHERALDPEENGYVMAIGTPIGLTKEQLDGAFLEGDITITDAPASMAKSVYMADMANNYISDFKYFDAMKAAGFNAVRLNIDWYGYIDNQTFQIDEAYLKAVERVVSYCTNLDLYVMLTAHNDYTVYSYVKPYVGDHNDVAWMQDKYKPYVDARFQAMWTQIAEWFRDYDEYLTFQPFNEPGMTDYSEYGADNPFQSFEEFNTLSIRRINEMNQIFIDAVRATGNNNTKRFLFFETHDPVFPKESVNSVVIPNDDRIILSLHCYPGKNPDDGFAPVQKWGAQECAYADRLLKWIADFKAKTGIPVVLDETATTTDHPNDVRIEIAKYFIDKAKDLGVPCYWWESMNLQIEPDGGHALGYDLVSKTWMHPDLLKAIMDVVYGTD